MKKTVVISGHPDIEDGYSNKIIISELKKNNNIEIIELASVVKDSGFDITAQQQKLLNADNIVFQFPWYWYSIPGIMKIWLDKVFSFNFAYGPEGNKLENKNFILSFTVGGPEDSYNSSGYQNFTIDEFLAPLKQVANLSKMKFLTPVVSHGMIYIPDVYNEQEVVEEKARQHAKKLLNLLTSV